MTTLAIASQKGGVGKTTVCLNLSFALAKRRWKVLLVDIDPQGSVGQSVKNAVRQGKGLTAYLEGGSLDEVVIKTRLAGFEVLIAGASPMRLSLAAETLTRALGRLVAESRKSYDVIIVDTPSGMYGMTEVVLRQSEHVLIPLQAEPLSLRTVRQVLDMVGSLKQEGSSLSVAGFIITMLSSRNEVSLNVAQEAWSMLPSDLVLDSFVPRDDAFLKASAYGVPLGLLSKRPPAAAAIFDQIASEMETRLGLVKEEENEGPLALLD